MLRVRVEGGLHVKRPAEKDLIVLHFHLQQAERATTTNVTASSSSSITRVVIRLEMHTVAVERAQGHKENSE